MTAPIKWLKQLRQLFAAADTDHNGSLTKQEMIAAGQRGGEHAGELPGDQRAGGGGTPKKGKGAAVPASPAPRAVWQRRMLEQREQETTRQRQRRSNRQL